MGWTGFAREPKNSRTASPIVRCAVVKTGELWVANCDDVLESWAGTVRLRIAPARATAPRIHDNTKPTLHTECRQRQITLLETIFDCELVILHAPS